MEAASIPRLQTVDPESLAMAGRVPVCARTHVFTTLVGQRSQERGGISLELFIENLQNVSRPCIRVAASSGGET